MSKWECMSSSTPCGGGKRYNVIWIHGLFWSIWVPHCNFNCAGFACVLESLTLLLTKIQVRVFFSDASTFHGKVSLSDTTLLQEISYCFCQRIGSLYSGIASGFHSLNCRCFLIFQLYLVYLCYQVCHCLWYEEPFSHWTSSQVPTKTMVNGLLMENIFFSLKCF